MVRGGAVVPELRVEVMVGVGCSSEGGGRRFKQRPVSTGVLAPPGGGRETRAAVMTDRHKLKTQDVTHKILQERKNERKKGKKKVER